LNEGYQAGAPCGLPLDGRRRFEDAVMYEGTMLQLQFVTS
jgi:hypothetical protein